MSEASNDLVEECRQPQETRPGPHRWRPQVETWRVRFCRSGDVAPLRLRVVDAKGRRRCRRRAGRDDERRFDDGDSGSVVLGQSGRVRRFDERLPGLVDVRAAFLVIERHSPGLNDDHDDTGMVMPSGRPARVDRDGGHRNVGRDTVAAPEADATCLVCSCPADPLASTLVVKPVGGVANAAPASWASSPENTASPRRNYGDFAHERRAARD